MGFGQNTKVLQWSFKWRELTVKNTALLMCAAPEARPDNFQLTTNSDYTL